MSQISQQVNTLLAAVAGAERIFAVMDAHPETDDGTATLVRVLKDGDTLTETDRRTGHWAWKKSDGSPALNPDLWAQALEQEARHKITYVWVKGHAGHPENERCDQLAVAQSKAHGGRQGT